MKEHSAKKYDMYFIFLHFMVVGLLIVSVILALQNRELKRGGKSAEPELLKVGDSVPALTVVDLNGKEKQILYTDSTKKTLLFIFNTTCPACKENSVNWTEIWKKYDTAKINLYPISFHKAERTIEYKKSNTLPYPIYIPKDSTLLKHYKPNAIPLTLLISKDKKVEKIFAGILTPAQIQELNVIKERW